MWKNAGVEDLTHSSLIALIDNSLPAVRITNFAGIEEIEILAEALLKNACRTSSIPEVTRLGISQYQQGLFGSKEDYFRMRAELEPVFKDIYTKSFDPVERFIHRLRMEGFDIDIMTEPGYGEYFAGSGKLRNGQSSLHFDYAPNESPGWAIANAKSQLAWNLYLRAPDEGGDLLVWDKRWSPEDIQYEIRDSLIYDHEVVADADPVRLTAVVGEILMINTKNYHVVTETYSRLAFGSFIGVFGDGQLRLWS